MPEGSFRSRVIIEVVGFRVRFLVVVQDLGLIVVSPGLTFLLAYMS